MHDFSLPCAFSIFPGITQTSVVPAIYLSIIRHSIYPLLNPVQRKCLQALPQPT